MPLCRFCRADADETPKTYYIKPHMEEGEECDRCGYVNQIAPEPEQSKFQALASVANFFVPAEVLSGVLLIFTMEHIFELSFSYFLTDSTEFVGWIAVYILGVLLISVMNYLSATEAERDALSDDIDDL